MLVAVAATSRKRYPRTDFKDREAFTKFVADEMAVITHGAVKNYNVRVPGANPRKWPDKMMPLGECFYEFIRCALAHEAMLPDRVEFFPGTAGENELQMEITSDRIRLSDSWMGGLAKAVEFAPENAAMYPENAGIPADVLPWMLFGNRRANHADYFAARDARVDS